MYVSVYHFPVCVTTESFPQNWDIYIITMKEKNVCVCVCVCVRVRACVPVCVCVHALENSCMCLTTTSKTHINNKKSGTKVKKT